MRSDADRGRDRLWWEKTWREREESIWSAFGPSHPPGSAEGTVNSFTYDHVIVPGACAYTFPPDSNDDPTGRRERRSYWLYVGHGLSQPPTCEAMEKARAAGAKTSGLGYEFAILLNEHADWPVRLLRDLIWYVAKVATIRDGDRMPAAFLGEGAQQRCVIGAPGAGDACIDQTRALVFFPYVSRFRSFTTSTGTMRLRVATTITQAEWDLAKTTSTPQLMLLLHHAGIGQCSIFGRADVLATSDAPKHWSRIKDMTEHAALNEFNSIVRPAK